MTVMQWSEASVYFLCTGGNVLLDATGQKVKLADFGTTIRCDGYLQDNSPRGTEAFMAPEVNMNCVFVVLLIFRLEACFSKSLFGLKAIKVSPLDIVVVHTCGQPVKWKILVRVIFGEDWCIW